jgi:hypothetical protein
MLRRYFELTAFAFTKALDRIFKPWQKTSIAISENGRLGPAGRIYLGTVDQEN